MRRLRCRFRLGASDVLGAAAIWRLEPARPTDGRLTEPNIAAAVRDMLRSRLVRDDAPATRAIEARETQDGAFDSSAAQLARLAFGEAAAIAEGDLVRAAALRQERAALIRRRALQGEREALTT